VAVFSVVVVTAAVVRDKRIGVLQLAMGRGLGEAFVLSGLWSTIIFGFQFARDRVICDARTVLASESVVRQ
jgi:hypothetical protein